MNKLIVLLIMIWGSSSLLASGSITPLVEHNWLKNNACQSGIVILDIRSMKIDGQSKSDYLKEHIPCAVHSDYIKDGWRVKLGNIPGMLPDTAKLETLIGRLGIDNDTHVVLVPLGKTAKSMGSATRLYWTFKVLGHDKVSILNGGYTAYRKHKENKIDKGEYTVDSKTFTARLRKDMMVSRQEVQNAINESVVLLDNRSTDQYLGINRHPKVKKHGTVPKSLNMPFTWFTVNNTGKFRSVDSLKDAYKINDVSLQSKQITLCNTGHAASIGWFVGSEILGNKQAKAYDGSMAEWSREPTLSVERKLTLRD